MGKLRKTPKAIITPNSTQIHLAGTALRLAGRYTTHVNPANGNNTNNNGLKRNAVAKSPCKKLCAARNDPHPGQARQVTT
jgi:hypothetical protein